MKNIVYVVFSLVFISCAGPVTEDATAVCECYRELYKIPAEETVQMEAVADSCGKLHANILRKLESDSVAHKEFIEAYTFCQNEK